jgi:hypothetical protein
MAEEAKAPQRPSVISWAIAVLGGTYIFMRVLENIFYRYNTSGSYVYYSVMYFLQYKVLATISYIGLLLSCVAAIVVVRAYFGLQKIRAEERELYNPVNIPSPATEPTITNSKWERIIELINSANPSDWRLAIIEADIMLDELLRSMSYHGDSVGDMLKSVEKSDFTTLDNAWEAHKIRNNIVHGGDNFDLNEREAKHAIALFESVFKEFKIV